MSWGFTQRNTLALDHNTTGTVYLTVEYELPSAINALEIAVPDFLSAERRSGFVLEGPHRWRWDQRTDRPWLRFQLQVNRTRGGGYEFVDTGSWALLRCPPINASWTYTGTAFELQQVYEVDNHGVASSDGNIVYLGSHDERRFTAGGQQFRFILPTQASLNSSFEKIAASLSHAAENLQVGGRNDDVVVIAAPSTVNWGWGGLHTGSNGFWAVDSSSVTHPSNTWVHEYVHTRQEWNRHHSTRWLLEGTTKLYAALLSYYQGRISFGAFHRYMSTTQHSNSILVDPSAWSSPNAHYTKGRRVTAALDAEIRRVTGNRHSFQDVFRRLNEVSGDLTYETFKSIVADVSGASLNSWLETYVEGTATPEIPHDPAAFGSPESPSDESEPEESEGRIEEEEPKIEQQRCQVCDSRVDESDEYCETCGTTLSKECPVCGCQVGDEPYCRECGTKLAEECDVCSYRRHESEQYCPRCGTEF